MTETNENTQTFEEKVKSMTAAEIIRAMVRGLKARHVKLDMDNFGTWKKNEAGEKVCFGCAATNAVCEISGKTFTPDTIRGMLLRSRFVNTGYVFLDRFEDAIDQLRRGRIGIYNEYADGWGFALIQDAAEDLPRLETDYTPDELAKYEALADAQEAK